MPRWPEVAHATLLLWALAAATGCTEPRARHARFEFQGQLLVIGPDGREVLIQHGDIKGFMPGMTMPFKVRDGQLLADKAPGDLVTAQLIVTGEEAWIDAIDKTGSAPLAGAASMPRAAFVTPVRPGDRAPDAPLIDQDGRPLSLAGWQRSAYAITFIYTRCPLPQFCPTMDRRFREVQRAITDDACLASRARLLSVSFDPEHDTPDALRARGAALGAETGVWSFATAPREAVDRLAASFGVNVIREGDTTITHNLRTAVIGPDGRVVSVHDGGHWTVDQIVADLRRALADR